MPVLYRSVIQRYTPSSEVRGMFPVFLQMVNECVRMGLANTDPTYENIKQTCLPRMKEYGVSDCYRVSAIFEATNLLKKFRTDSKRAKVNPPMCRNPYLAVSLGVWLERDRITLPDLGSVSLTPHTAFVLTQSGVGLTSVTLTPTTCSVIYHKSVESITPSGLLAVDLNLDNATTWDSDGRSASYDLRALTTIHETYRRVKSRFRRNDVRVKRRLYRKYAAREWDKKSAILHRVSSQIVRQAKTRRQALALEDLRGIREMYRRSSGGAASYLSKMNAWPFRQLLRQVAYKAEWVGLPVCTVSPEWTSEKCSLCGGRMETPPMESRDIVCVDCGLVIDRDLNGAKNILKRALRSGAVRFADEAMVGGQAPARGPNAKVDAGHPSIHTG